jgi:hypothetical protein
MTSYLSVRHFLAHDVIEVSAHRLCVA